MTKREQLIEVLIADPGTAETLIGICHSIKTDGETTQASLGNDVWAVVSTVAALAEHDSASDFAGEVRADV